MGRSARLSHFFTTPTNLDEYGVYIQTGSARGRSGVSNSLPNSLGTPFNRTVSYARSVQVAPSSLSLLL